MGKGPESGSGVSQCRAWHSVAPCGAQHQALLLAPQKAPARHGRPGLSRPSHSRTSRASRGSGPRTGQTDRWTLSVGLPVPADHVPRGRRAQWPIRAMGRHGGWPHLRSRSGRGEHPRSPQIKKNGTCREAQGNAAASAPWPRSPPPSWGVGGLGGWTQGSLCPSLRGPRGPPIPPLRAAGHADLWSPGPRVEGPQGLTMAPSRAAG